jgi:hypothetical protein
MKRFITLEDINIYNENDLKKKHRHGYNIGDLLNMPNLSDSWKDTPHQDETILRTMNLVGNTTKSSILSFYCNNRKSSDSIPDVELIKKSVIQFTDNNKHLYFEILNQVKDPNTLCVHVRNGDIKTEESHINLIEKMSEKYEKVIILSGIHSDESYVDDNYKKTNFLNTINSILNKNNNIFIYLDKPDIHLSLMMYASNLLLHKGGFSCLGSIISTGNLFITDHFHYENKYNWKKKVNKEYIKI